MSINELDVIEASYPPSSPNSRSWSKSDTTWMLSMYGTAIGAGTLFLPINAGIHGFIPLIVLAILAYPMTFYSHRALCRFVLSGSCKKSNITAVVDEHFGHRAGQLLTFLYFFSIYPIVLMYSVGITNTTQSFLQFQMEMVPPGRALVAFLLLIILMGVVRFGQKTIIKAMSYLVYPFVFVLMGLAFYLIPHWNGAIFSYQSASTGDLISSLWLGIPVLIFSFNHSAIISAFAVGQRGKYGARADEQCSNVLKYTHLLMVVTVLFFVFSCVLSLSPSDLAQAKSQNISILSYLANHFHQPFISYVAPVVAFVAIAKSFLGHYIGASEGLHGLIIKYLRKKKVKYCNYQIYILIDSFMILTCWIVATINPSILGMIEVLGGPIVAALLFLMPMYAIRKVPAMKKFRNPVIDIFITVIGLISISAIVYSLLV